MSVVLDTNVLVSALLQVLSGPSKIVNLWRHGRKFDLLTSTVQIEELMRVTRYPKIRTRIDAAVAGRLINELRDLTIVVTDLLLVQSSPDPYDNYLLSIALGGYASYLVTGDNADLLMLKKFEGIGIASVSHFLSILVR